MRTSSARVLGKRSADRRKSARHPLSVPCTVASEGTTFGVYWTEDLGADGALLNHGGSTFGKGSVLDVTLHFPWTGSVPIEAAVVRHHRSKFAVRFRPTTSMAGALARSRIERAVRLRREAQPGHQVSLILSARESLASDLEADITELGGRPVLVTRPLDAIWYLSDSDRLVGSVFTDGTLLTSSGNWLRFLENAFPHVTRVLVSDDPLPRAMSALLVSRRVHAVMAVPWRVAYLADLIRVETRDRFIDIVQPPGTRARPGSSTRSDKTAPRGSLVSPAS